MQGKSIESEEDRLDALYALHVLDSEADERFDRATRLAKAVTGMPIALLSLVDRDRQWFLSRQEMTVCETGRDSSFCTHAISGDAPFVVPDARIDPRFSGSPLVTDYPFVVSYVGIPLVVDGGAKVGTICCMDQVPREPTSEQLDALRDLASMVVDALRLHRDASTDRLTSSLVRGAFMDALKRDVAASRAAGRPLACAMIDVDRFKSVNDTMGHAVGDSVLKLVVEACKSSIRQGDYVGRLGGDEFAVVMRNADPTGALVVAERIRATLAKASKGATGDGKATTISVGIATLDSSMEGPEALVAAADVSLYRAKRQGRDVAVVSDAMLAGMLRVA